MRLQLRIKLLLLYQIDHPIGNTVPIFLFVEQTIFFMFDYIMDAAGIIANYRELEQARFYNSAGQAFPE